MAVDIQVSAPLYFDIGERETRLRATIGVRLAKLDGSYAKPPKIKPNEGAGEWQDVTWDQLEAVQYVIAVDEFAEVGIRGLQPLTREELRKICNAHKTKPEILQALSEWSP